ncbi:hypothetical protein L9F63_021538, partial [Diploptera punctata]
MHRALLARKYRLALTPEQKKQFELKVLAEKLFKEKKKSYPQSVGPRFIDDRLNEEQKPLKQAFQVNQLNGEKIMYSTSVTKYDRHGYKPRERALLLTNKHLFVLDGKTFKIKHSLGFDIVQEIVVTTESDNLLLVRIPPEYKKDKGDLILEVNHLIEAVTMVVDVTKKPQILKIMEAGTIAHNLIGGKQGVIDITTGTNHSIVKGKSGHLVVSL